MPDEVNKKTIEIQVNDTLPTVFVDNLNITTRGDGNHLVRLLTFLPEGLREQLRIMVPDQALRNMIDVLCSHTHYYPSKPEGSSEK